jgi:hypothetical protein
VNKLKGSAKDAIVGIFSIDFTDQSKSLSEKIFGLFDGILKNLQSWAANKLGDVFMAAINPGSSDKGSQARNPGGVGQTAANVGMAALGSAGGGWGQLAATALSSIFADGGEVGKGFESMNTIDRILQTERVKSNGKMPVLAALHMNEQVLTTKNKDAQAFRAFQQSGVWDALKETHGFASGGQVGKKYDDNIRFNRINNKNNTKSINTVNNFNFTSTETQLIKRTEAQVKNRKDQFLS